MNSNQALHEPCVTPVDFATLRFRDVMEEPDRECMAVYEILKEAVARCAGLVAPYENVPLLMFPVFMTILTQYRLFVHEQKRGIVRPDLQFARQSGFPYIDHVDIAHGLNATEKEIDTVEPVSTLPSLRWRYFALAKILDLVPGRRRVALFQCEMSGDLVNTMVRNGFRPVTPSVEVLGVRLAAQWPAVEAAVDRICDCFAMTRDQRALIDIFRAHTRRYLVEGKPAPLAADILVVGTLAHVANRVMAARARAANIPVVTVGHGEGSGVVGDPVCGYGERTLATHELGFAAAGMRDRLTMPDAHSLIAADEPLGAIPSDAQKIAAIFDPDAEIEPLHMRPGLRTYYVPTGFNNLHTYGPGRSLPDLVYARWQTHVLEQFPEAILKAYPWQSEAAWAYADIDPARICRSRLEDVIDMADAFILDYSSTSLMLACATAKPVIFFDLGLRRHSKLGLETIRDRCVYLSVERVIDHTLRRQVLARAGERKRNRVIPTFSLEGLREPRERSLIRGLKQSLGARAPAQGRSSVGILDREQTLS